MPPRDRTRRRVTPTQARAQASIDAILTAAELLLREEGFARATTNRIATRAGVNVALVYRYFAGKEAIVGALIERVAEATYEAVRRALVEHARAPLPTAVRALLDALVDTPSAPALHRELVEHVDVARRRQLVHELRSRIAAQFAELLVRRRAELRPLADRDATMFVLQHAIEAATHAAAFYRPDGLSIERTLDALTELVTRALLPVADRPAAPARAR
jgi:AcrR family transcriptional regulator